MAASLQSRVQLLAILAVAFTLVSVPLFYQVRADVNESKETAKSTFLSKLFNDVARDLKAKPPEDLQVEDAWRQWQEENPDCGAACDPKADPDGDGVSNRDEVEQGRNPACNEEREGEDYCKGRPPVIPPDANTTEPLDEILFQRQVNQDWNGETFPVREVLPNFDRWELTWRVTGFQGFGDYRFRIFDEDGQSIGCCKNNQVPFLSSDHQDAETLEGTEVPPSAANYRIQLDANSAVQGSWTILIRGVRDAPAA